MTLKKSGNFINSCKGQVTIFFAVLIITILGLFAFVINVGLFVKTKINFQNAVDGAAFAGAAVQARQLTNIAYMNWELHNTYKEWMFKYYVLGQASLTNTLDINFAKNTPNMSFRARPLDEAASSNIEPYNLPSVCIQPINNRHNVCEIYDVPGLPRFSPMGIAGIDDEQRAFINSVSAQKALDCAKLSQINFSTLLQWIYGVDDSEALPGAPQIAAGRMGAWPQALEIGMRIRNLEMIVNRPPISNGICATSIAGCSTTINTLLDRDTNNPFPVNERPIKAFLSAYKALGGAFYQNNPSELKRNLILYELAPKAVDTSKGETLDNFLIPVDAGSSDIPKPREKFYLNLKVMPINFVNFFTFFVPTVGSNDGIRTDVECKGSKTAIPVPGYIFGFVKDPEVLTYYAVKAETKYIGLLYPFADQSGIPMRAYAAAKPFGGRIGPHTFDTSAKSVVTARGVVGEHFKSAPFISGIDVSTVGSNFIPGYPLPLAPIFWVADASSPIGGNPKAGTIAPTFGIPNMLYDITTDMTNQIGSGTQKIGILTRETTYAGAYQNVQPAVGLYDRLQFQQLSKPYQSIFTAPTVANINHAIDQSRHPTRYDALNYLVPTIFHNNQGSTYDAPSAVINSADPRNDAPQPKGSFGDIFEYSIYAPLFVPGSLYETPTQAEKIIQAYISNNQTSVNTFLAAFYEAAQGIRAAAGSEDPEIYEDGARAVHDGASPTSPTCKSIAGRFNAFFTGDLSRDECNKITPLKQKIISNWSVKNTSGGSFNLYYTATYALPTSDVDRIMAIDNDTLMTAYAPGKTHYRQGTDQIIYPYTADTYAARRNYYSTKFISLSRVLNSPIPGMGDRYITSGLPALWDNDSSQLTHQNTGYQFINPIKAVNIQDWFKYLDH